jgi:hypothetical protein
MRFLADESVERKVVEKLREATDKVTGCPDKFAEQREGWKMAFVEPYKPRAKIAEVENAVHIEIPLRPKDFMAWFAWSLLTAFLLLAWSAPVAIAFQLTKASPQEKPPLLFTALFITVWLLITVLLSMAWCQMTFGREIITVTPQELTFWQQPFGQRRRFHLAEVKNLRVLEDAFALFANLMRFWWLWHFFPGVLAFDYGAGTVRFGANLDPAEARQIVALLKERFGQYMADRKVEAGS